MARPSSRTSAAHSFLTIARRKVPVSNLEKVLYPAGRFTKAQVIDYYTRISPYLLPHLKDRPVTLKRYPNGVFGEFFYEKDAPSFTPDWVKRFPVPRREGGMIDYILINDLPTLVWVANTASLELHPFLHRVPHIDTPTHVVFDLDPGEGTDILTCGKVAFLLKDVFDEMALKTFVKVSGSKGIQLYVPLNSTATYSKTQPFAKSIAERLEREHPSLVVSQMSKALRRGKVFIDWSQNADHKTTVAVYSLRAKKERPFVSLPITWEELRSAVNKGQPETLYFEAEQAIARVKKTGDLFSPVLKLKQHLPESRVTAEHTPKRLQEYAAKRNFRRTTEPTPTVPRSSAQGSRRRFVVQKHAASHLHYDLRLEMHDTLKSWSVPKGMPVKEGEGRSAFATEDHPLEYLSFEGTIPEGQYGGGTVMVWDIGTYELVEGNYYKGKLVVSFKGKKLKGEWTVEKISGETARPKWLITKTNGDAKTIGAKQDDTSALSGRRFETIGKAKDAAVWQSNRAAIRTPKLRSNPVNRTTPPARVTFVAPMKPTLVSELPSGDEWIYEVKWDGYRALAIKNADSVQLLSAKNKNLGADFPDVAAAASHIPADAAVLDGEIVAVNKQGQPSFQMLRKARPRLFWFGVVVGGFAVAFVSVIMVTLVSQYDALHIRSVTAADDVQGRLELWKVALQQFRLEPLVGTGSGTYYYFSRLFQPRSAIAHADYAHNDYLQFLAEFGILGMALLLIFVGAHLRAGWRAASQLAAERAGSPRSQTDRLAFTVASLAAVASYLAHSIVDFNMHIPANALLMAVCFGLLANPGIVQPQFPRSRISVRVARFAMPAFAVWMAFIGLKTWPAEYYGERARLALCRQDYESSIALAGKAIEYDRTNPFIWLYLAQGHAEIASSRAREESTNAWVAAAAAFSHGLKLFPQERWLLLGLGEALDSLGQFSDADQQYQSALRVDPNSAEVRALYAMHLRAAGRLTEAEESFRKSLALRYTFAAAQGLEKLAGERRDGNSRVQ